jgi:hypothetical protein
LFCLVICALTQKYHQNQNGGKFVVDFHHR